MFKETAKFCQGRHLCQSSRYETEFQGFFAQVLRYSRIHGFSSLDLQRQERSDNQCDLGITLEQLP